MRRKTLLRPRHAVIAAVTLSCVLGCTTPDSGKAIASPVLPPAAPAMPASASPEAAVSHWTLSERDKTLKGALQRWSQTAGWRLVWELGVDYRIDATASIDGTFEAAISAVVKNMEQADVPPKAIFYRSNQVLRVVPRGME